MTTGDLLLEARGLVAGYGDVEVLHGIDLEVRAGEVVALLGPNGAGKTTTLHTIAGLVAHRAGTLRLLGVEQPVARRRAVARTALRRRAEGVALVAEDRALFFGLTAREHLRLAARRGDDEAIDQALAPFAPLRAILDRRAGLMSGGEQQMLAVARALVARPKLLMIDELSLGLAPIVVESLLPLVASVAHDTGVGVLLVEQHVSAALQVADRALVMVRGEASSSRSAAELAHDASELASAYLGNTGRSPNHPQ